MVDVISLLKKAHESYDRQNFDEGIKYLDSILKDRNILATLHNKGLCLAGSVKYEEAIKWFNRVSGVESKIYLL
jgi:tetratricopeptide (TPR) repeat protein